MVGFIDKLKQQFEIWKIEKYTKRRTFLPEYDSKDKDYYERYYRDGVYYSTADSVPPLPSETQGNKLKALQRAPSVATKRASVLLRRSTTTTATTTTGSRRGTPPPRCSETYNAHHP